jgi:glutathione S-transferase
MPESAQTARRPVIRLYTQTVNPFSEKVAAALALKGLAYQRIVSDQPEDVARWSPIARTLPVLEIDGRRKADSLAIVAWLDTLHPDPPLYSSDPRTAVAQKSLAEWSDDSFLWYWNRWRTARYPRPDDEQPPEDSRIGRLWERVERRLGRKPQSRADQRELEVIAEIQDRLSDLVGFLGTRPFFHGSDPSIADLSIYSMLLVLRGGAIPGCAEAIAERPTLSAFIDRMAARIASVEERRLVDDATG